MARHGCFSCPCAAPALEGSVPQPLLAGVQVCGGAALRRNKCGCAMSRSAKLGNGAASTGGCLSRDIQTHSLPTNSQTHRGHWQHVGQPPEQCVPWDHARQSPKLAGLCSARGTNYSPALPALPSPLTNCFRSAKACGHIN